MVPVLFEIELKYEDGIGKVYLHDDKHSNYEEEEYLIGGKGWTVMGMSQNMETYYDDND